MAVRRAPVMPVQDDRDRCGRCGKVIKRGEARAFVDTAYARTLRVDARCASMLRKLSGYRELEFG